MSYENLLSPALLFRRIPLRSNLPVTTNPKEMSWNTLLECKSWEAESISTTGERTFYTRDHATDGVTLMSVVSKPISSCTKPVVNDAFAQNNKTRHDVLLELWHAAQYLYTALGWRSGHCAQGTALN